jgi:hypothetical protein
MTAPAPDPRPVYPTFEKALAAQEQQLRAYGVYSGIIHPARRQVDAPLRPDRRQVMGKPPSVLYLRIPTQPGKDIQVTGSFPVTETQWQMFIDVLAAMKPGLVQADAETGVP